MIWKEYMCMNWHHLLLSNFWKHSWNFFTRKMLFWVISLPLYPIFNHDSIKHEKGPSMLPLKKEWTSSPRYVGQILISTLVPCTENFKRPDLASIIRNCYTKRNTSGSVLLRSQCSAAVLCPSFLPSCPMKKSGTCHVPLLASTAPFFSKTVSTEEKHIT